MPPAASRFASRSSSVIRCAALALLACGCAAGDADGERPSVILITLDTTRPDHLGCYGYERPTSPNLDLLASESVLYERAYSTSSWTLPAHASLFTGRFPRSHGARYDSDGPLVITSALAGPEYWDQYRARSIAVDETTLASTLRAHGYQTAAIVAGPWLKRVFGLDRGFDHYDDSAISETNGRSAADVTRAARTWLGARDQRPFLLFLNYYDPHTPHRPPPGFGEMFLPAGKAIEDLTAQEAINSLYDAEIRFMDQHVGRLFQELRELGLYETSWIIVTSDHGELLGENGLQGHGRYLTEAEIRVPLIVKAPGSQPGRRSDALVQLTDIVPHVLGELDIPIPPGVQGNPLNAVRHPIVAETYPLDIMRGKGDWQAIVVGSLKYAWNSRGESYLVDVLSDPAETHNLLDEMPEHAAKLERGLHGFLNALPPPGAAGPAQVIDDETMRMLRNLGYVDTEAESK